MRVERVQHSHATAEDRMLTSMSRVGHERVGDEIGPESVVVWGYQRNTGAFGF